MMRVLLQKVFFFDFHRNSFRLNGSICRTASNASSIAARPKISFLADFFGKLTPSSSANYSVQI